MGLKREETWGWIFRSINLYSEIMKKHPSTLEMYTIEKCVQFNLGRDIAITMYLSFWTAKQPSLQAATSPNSHLSERSSLQAPISPNGHLFKHPSLQATISPSIHLSKRSSLQASISPSSHLPKRSSLQAAISSSSHLSKLPSQPTKR